MQTGHIFRALCLLFTVSIPPAMSATIRFDFATVDFSYVCTNPGAGVGQVIGTITLTENPLSGVVVDDGVVSTAISPGAAFSLSVAADVIKGAGANQYSISSTNGLSATDATGVSKVAASFSSSAIALIPVGGITVFSFTGPAGVLGGNDAILINGVGDSWSYVGNQPPPYAPAIVLPSGRSLYDLGLLVELHLQPGSVPTLDAFFGLGGAPGLLRSASTADLKLEVVPEPASLLLLATGFLALRRRA